ncbi:MAG: hypothetical protein H6824_20780 [Planctomycetaceae bacterium]|nr:hypothetical protein [Planctomycetaceae bacterium]
MGICDDATTEPAKSEVVWDELAVHVVDEKGKPVEGVTVTPWALGSRLGHGAWSRERFGKPETKISGADGKLTLKYPQFHYEQVKVGAVSVNVDHPDYCWGSEHLPVGNLVRVTVKRGTQLRIKTFTPESKGALTDVFVLHPDLYAPPAAMQRVKDDWVITRPVEGESGVVRVVSIVPDEPAFFSSSLPWNRRDDGGPQVVVLTLEKGVQVKGKLSDDVPRPIKRGQVSVECMQLNDVESPWEVWMDYAEIQPDGTFTFESLPPGTDLHFIAMCEGYVSAKPSEERFAEICERYEDMVRRNSYEMYPQVFTPESNLVEITLDMIPTFDVVLHAHDKAGNPIEGVQLGVNPNQYTFRLGSRIAGSCHRSAEYLLKPDFTWLEPFSNFRYYGRTDENGDLRIENLMSSHVTLGAWENENWDIPEKNGRRSVNIQLTPDEKRVDVLLQPKGTDTLE